MLTAPFREQQHQRLHHPKVLDLAHVAQVLARQLLASQRAPTPGEPAVATQERFGETAVLPQRFPIRGGDLRGRLDLSLRQLRSQALPHAPGMHAIEEIAPHQAVPASAEHVQSRASRHDQACLVAVRIEEALEQLLPLGVLVQFVEDRHGRFGPQAIQAERHRQRRGTPEQRASIVRIVVIEVLVANRTARGRLADLARPAHQRHLAMPIEVVTQDRAIQPGVFRDATNIASVAKWSRPFYDVGSQ